VLLVLVAAGSLAVAVAEEPKADGGKTKSQPKELTVDLGKGIKLEMVLIPAGEFLMGSPDSDKSGRADERPQHRVRITRPFYLGKYLVTQEQWQAVMGNNPSEFKGPKNPVDSVGWEDCREFLKRLNKLFVHTGIKASLPTEAQWEYACRAGSTTRYFYGDEDAKLAEYAWFNENSLEKTHPVGQKKPNAWGLYDMHGSLFQWCADWYDGDYYKSSPTSDPCGPSSGSLHIDRGGCWNSLPRGCCSAFRHTNSPRPDHFIGLRLLVMRQDSTDEPTKEKPR